MNLHKTKKICLWVLTCSFLIGITFNTFALPKNPKLLIKEMAVKKTENDKTYSFSNPAPIGTTQKILIKNFLGLYKTDITVKSVFRGKEAYEIITEDDVFKKAPPAPPSGYEYILVKIKDNGVPEENQNYTDSVETIETRLVSDNGNDYVLHSFYLGVKNEIWFSYLIKKDDSQPRLAVKKDSKGDIWFQAYPVSSNSGINKDDSQDKNISYEEKDSYDKNSGLVQMDSINPIKYNNLAKGNITLDKVYKLIGDVNKNKINKIIKLFNAKKVICIECNKNSEIINVGRYSIYMSSKNKDKTMEDCGLWLGFNKDGKLLEMATNNLYYFNNYSKIVPILCSFNEKYKMELKKDLIDVVDETNKFAIENKKAISFTLNQKSNRTRQLFSNSLFGDWGVIYYYYGITKENKKTIVHLFRIL